MDTNETFQCLACCCCLSLLCDDRHCDWDQCCRQCCCCPSDDEEERKKNAYLEYPTLPSNASAHMTTSRYVQLGE